MALQKDTISIPLAQGVDTKTDPKQVEIGKLLACDNGVFKNPKEISLRNGFDQLATSGISSGRALANFKDALLELDGTSVYQRSPTLGTWQSVGTKIGLSYSSLPVVNSNYSQTAPDVCYHSNGLSLYAWQDSSGGVRYSIYDTSSNQAIVNNQLAGASYSLPRCATVGSNLVLFVYNSTNGHIDYLAFPVATPTSPVSPVNLLTASTSLTVYDVYSAVSTFYILYTNGSGDLITALYSSVFALTNSATTTSTAISACQVTQNSSGNIWITYNNVTALFYKVYNSALTSVVLTSTQVDTAADPEYIGNVTISELSSTTMWIAYEIISRLFKNFRNNVYTKQATISSAGVISAQSTLLRSVGISSKAFSVNSVPYVLLQHDSPLQPTYFLAKYLTGEVAAKLAPSVSGGMTSGGIGFSTFAAKGLTNDYRFAGINNLIPSVASIGSSQYLMPYRKKTITETDNGIIVAIIGIFQATLDFTYKPKQMEIANNTLLDGGIISLYDGQSVAELGFNLFPEYLLASTTLTNVNYASISSQIIMPFFRGGGALSKGQYQYLATYEWIDNQGQLHRSAPSADAATLVAPLDVKFTGDLHSASALVDDISGNGAIYVAPGFKAESSSDPTRIPAWTHISSITNATSLNNDTNSTASVNDSSLVYTGGIFIKNSFLTGSVSASNLIATDSPTSFSVAAVSVAGASTVVASDASTLKVGMTLKDYVGGGYVSGKITAISGYTVTLDTPNSGSAVNIQLQASIPDTGTFTSGSATVTGLSTTFTGLCKVGYPVYSAKLTAGKAYVSTISSTSITLDANAAATGSDTINLATPYFTFLKKGHILKDKNGLEATIIDFSFFGFELEKIQVDTIPGSFDYTDGLFIENIYGTLIESDSLRVTSKNSTTNPVQVVFYRTTADGTVFRRASAVSNAVYNTTTADAVTFYDSISDFELDANQLLYTTGGEVENIAPPASTIRTQYKNRVILVPSEDLLSWWYSKQVLPGFPVEFSDLFVQGIDQRGGGITATGVMDDKLVFFKQSVPFYIIGDGPSPSGANNDFTYPQLIASDTGCTDVNSVVSTPFGIIYKSLKGFFLLDRGLGTKYIGDMVESSNALSVVSAQTIPDSTRVRFVMSDGSALEWDYYVMQWSTLSGFTSVASTNYLNKFTFLKSDGSVFKENSTTFTDGSSAIPMTVTTSWLSFAKVQGFQRVRRLEILGEYKSHHTLRVDISYDFDPTIVQTDTITVTSSVVPEQYLIHLARQKCESLKVKLTMTPTSPLGEGMSISNLAFEVGVKKGLDKLPSTQSYG